jgi:hypothetical protein
MRDGERCDHPVESLHYRADIDFGGYCQRCRTYRGGHVYGAEAPASGTPAAPYPVSPYAGAGPGGPAGYAGADYAGAAPGGPAGYRPQPDPPAPARTGLPIHLFVLTAVVVVLVAGIVGVVVIRSGSRTGSGHNQTAALPPPQSPSSAPSSAGPSAPAVDKCVVGQWTVTYDEFSIPDDTTGRPEMFVGRGGDVMRFLADGSGDHDFSNGVTFTGRLAGKPATIAFKGTFTFNFTTANKMLTYRNTKVDAEYKITTGGRTEDWPVPDQDGEPDAYTCGGNLLVIQSDGALTKLRRS